MGIHNIFLKKTASLNSEMGRISFALSCLALLGASFANVDRVPQSHNPVVIVDTTGNPVTVGDYNNTPASILNKHVAGTNCGNPDFPLGAGNVPADKHDF